MTATLLGQSPRANVPQIDTESFELKRLEVDPAQLYAEREKLRALLDQLDGLPELEKESAEASKQLGSRKSDE